MTFDEIPTKLESIDQKLNALLDFNRKSPVNKTVSEYSNSEKIANKYEIPLATIRKWNFEKRYPTSKAGRHVLIKISDFENFLCSKTRYK